MLSILADALLIATRLDRPLPPRNTPKRYPENVGDQTMPSKRGNYWVPGLNV